MDARHKAGHDELVRAVDRYTEAAAATEEPPAEHAAVRQKLKHEGADPRWILGDDSISAGSLHCDVWAGPAIDLLQRDTLCIKPVNGWCRKRADEKVCNRRTRYALVVSFKALDTDLDVYTPIATAVQIPIPIETQM